MGYKFEDNKAFDQIYNDFRAAKHLLFSSGMYLKRLKNKFYFKFKI